MEGEVKGKTFKMKGHTLPGINQRSETKNLADGRSKSSTFQQSENVAAMEMMKENQGDISSKLEEQQIPEGISKIAENSPINTPLNKGQSKPSIAKDKVVRKPWRKEAVAHNTKAATEQHFGDPHGPKPSAAKQAIGGGAGEQLAHYAKYRALPGAGVATALAVPVALYSFGKESVRRKKAGLSGFNLPKPPPKKDSDFNIKKGQINKPFTFNR